MNAPGTSIPRAAYLEPMSAKRLYDSAINAYQPTVPDVGQQLTYNPLIQPARIGMPIQGLVGVPGQGADSGAVRPAASALFGIMRRSDHQNLVDELADAELARRAGRIESRVESRIQPTPSETEPKKTDKTTTPDAEPARLKAPPPGQDVFIDILLTMEKMRAEEKERADHPNRQEKPSRDRKRFQPDQTDDPNTNDEGLTVPDKQPEDAAVRQVRNKIVLARLAGSNRDLFNLNMSRAEKKLSEGEYYTAAGYYDVAEVLNRGNPLAPLGAALALFAAGEPFSAALHLRQAMDRFPPVMETRVDAKAILGWQIVELRIGRLEKRLADKEEPVEPSLVFLAAFIRASMDQPDQAAKHAQTLAKIAGKEDKTYLLYAKHLLKTVSTTTQPAKSGK
jgi:tetratricopeptide (TPR) repeat protein